MKKSEIKAGDHYIAKVGGKVVTVRVDAIREVSTYRAGTRNSTHYDVTNLSTGRRTTFRSAAKFRSACDAKGRTKNDKAMMEVFGCPDPDSDL